MDHRELTVKPGCLGNGMEALRLPEANCDFLNQSGGIASGWRPEGSPRQLHKSRPVLTGCRMDSIHEDAMKMANQTLRQLDSSVHKFLDRLISLEEVINLAFGETGGLLHAHGIHDLKSHAPSRDDPFKVERGHNPIRQQSSTDPIGYLIAECAQRFHLHLAFSHLREKIEPRTV